MPQNMGFIKIVLNVSLIQINLVAPLSVDILEKEKHPIAGKYVMSNGKQSCVQTTPIYIYTKCTFQRECVHSKYLKIHFSWNCNGFVNALA